jgi:hypothetical protein
MKFLILFLFPFFMTSTNDVTPTSPTASEAESLSVRICWKGPKGNRTCITVSRGNGLRDGSEIMTDAFMSNEGMILRFSDSNVTSFTIAENASVEGCSSNINLKKGTKVDVVNGLAIIE